MNMAQAKKEGLVFIGLTAEENDKEDINNLKNEANKIRKLGFRAISVKSNMNEWGNGCYCLFADPMYEKYEQARTYKMTNKKFYEEERKKLQEKYEAELVKIENEEAKAWEFVEEVEKKLGYIIEVF